MSFIKRYLNPKNDVAFKHIFGTEKNKDILIAMLNAVVGGQLHTKIEDVVFLSPMQEPEALAKKQSIVDVLCRDTDGCQYIIEMQVADTAGFEERAQYYASKAFVSQADKGSAYKDLKEVIFLAFCDFAIFPEKKHYKSEHITLDKHTYEQNLDKLSFTFVDLVKFDEQRSGEVAHLCLEEKFYYFLCHAEDMKDEELTKLVGEDQVIRKAFHELERFGWSEEEIRRYEQEDKRICDNRAAMEKAVEVGRAEGKAEGRAEGKAEGRAEGKAEGRAEGKAEGIKLGEQKGKEEERRSIIQQFLASGMQKVQIARVLGISIARLEELLG